MAGPPGHLRVQVRPGLRPARGLHRHALQPEQRGGGGRLRPADGGAVEDVAEPAAVRVPHEEPGAGEPATREAGPRLDATGMQGRNSTHLKNVS